MNVQLKSLIAGTGLALLTTTAMAQSSAGTSSSSTGNNAYQSSGTENSSLTQPNSQNSNQFFQAKNFIGEKVHNTQDQNLGTIKDIVFNPKSGETFAAIDVGSSRYALVPWQALTVTAKGSRGKEQAQLNMTKQQLASAPTIPQDQWEELNNKTFVQSIYSHYNVQAPMGMGGSLGTGTSGTSTGSSSDTGTSGTGTSQSSQTK